MAYAKAEDEELVPNTGGVATGPEAGAATLQGDASMAGGTPTAAAGQPVEKAGSAVSDRKTPFVGIQKYLDANKAQSVKQAQDVGGLVTGAGEEARSTLGKQAGLFNQAVDKGVVNLDKGVFDAAKQNVAKVASDKNQSQIFKNMANAQYGGPQDFETNELYKPADEALKRAQQASENTQTAQGQKSLVNQLQQKMTGKIAGSGVTAFDQMLLQGQGARDTLAKAREATSDIPELAKATQAQTAERIKQAQAQTAATRQAVQNEFGYGGASGQQRLEDQLKQRAAGQIAETKAAQDRVSNALRSGNLGALSEQDRAQLGLTTGNSPYIENLMRIAANKGAGNIDLSGALSFASPEAQISAQNVATADEYARYQALNDLMNGTGSFLTNPSLAGTANRDAMDFNLGTADRYLNEIIGKAVAAENARNAAAKAAADKAAADKAAADRAAQERAAAQQAQRALYGAKGPDESNYERARQEAAYRNSGGVTIKTDASGRQVKTGGK